MRVIVFLMVTVFISVAEIKDDPASDVKNLVAAVFTPFGPFTPRLHRYSFWCYRQSLRVWPSQ